MATAPVPPRDGSGFPQMKEHRVEPHPLHPRLRRVVIDAGALRAFFAALADVSVRKLEYVPYMRFIAARELDTACGGTLGSTLRAIVADRALGGCVAAASEPAATVDDAVKFATALAHLLGPAQFDAMSGSYYARFEVRHADAGDSYLHKAYDVLTLHTDGTFVAEPTDWIFMMKLAEKHARGGESRLLHLDDWADLERFANAPLAAHEFEYKPASSKNVSAPIVRPTFFAAGGRPGISFIDQFVYPRTPAQAAYLHDLSRSLESAPATATVALPAGEAIVLNNAFWLHGRAAFTPDPKLRRELLRQRGAWSAQE